MTDLYVGFNNLNDYERGELDCILGYPALDNESADYYLGYGNTYELMEVETGRVA